MKLVIRIIPYWGSPQDISLVKLLNEHAKQIVIMPVRTNNSPDSYPTSVKIVAVVDETMTHEQMAFLNNELE